MIYYLIYDSKEHWDWWNNNRQVGDIVFVDEIASFNRKPNERVKVTKVDNFEVIDFTEEVNNWLTINNIKYPFNKEDETLFLLTFG